MSVELGLSDRGPERRNLAIHAERRCSGFLGVALNVAALIALIILGLLYRRKSYPKHPSTATTEMAYTPYSGQSQGQVEITPVLPGRRAEYYKRDLNHDSSAAKYEMPSQGVMEIDGRSQVEPAELPERGERRSMVSGWGNLMHFQELRA